MKDRAIAALLAALCCCLVLPCAAQTIEWDTSTQHLIAPGGVYGRVTRLANGDLMLVEDFGGQTYVQRSTNDGASWSARALVGQNPSGIATNGEILQLQNGSVMVLWNDR